MKGIVLRSFAGKVDGKTQSFGAGQEIEIPKGVDWVKAGFVRPLSTTKAKVKSKAISTPEETR